MSYGIFNYENDEIGTCMMLIYDLEEQNNQLKSGSVTNKGSGYKLESDYSIKSKNSEETTNRNQRPMSGMSYQKKQNETNMGFSNSKQSDFNFFNTPQQFNGLSNLSTPLMQGHTQSSNNSNNNYNQNILAQTAPQQINQNIGYQNGNQFYSNQRSQNLNQQVFPQHQQQSQSNDNNLYQKFANMMKNMDEETIKSLMNQYQNDQREGKQKKKFM